MRTGRADLGWEMGSRFRRAERILWRRQQTALRPDRLCRLDSREPTPSVIQTGPSLSPLLGSATACCRAHPGRLVSAERRGRSLSRGTRPRFRESPGTGSPAGMPAWPLGSWQSSRYCLGRRMRNTPLTAPRIACGPRWSGWLAFLCGRKLGSACCSWHRQRRPRLGTESEWRVGSST
jgi:hypothetical protein